MHDRPMPLAARPGTQSLVTGPLVAIALLLVTAPAPAHEIWVESAASDQVGREQEIRVCWGHSGHRESGEALKGQQSKLTAWLVRPDSQSQRLALSAKADCFTAAITSSAPGTYAVGAVCQTGILDREFHGMPAKTRIIMAGKTVVRVGTSGPAIETPLQTDLELVPVGELLDLRPGAVAAAKVAFKKAPIGGRTVLVSLSTIGNRPFPKDPEVEGLAWSVESTAHPGSGEVRFPLIVGGRHIFAVKYMDETPGRYEGDLEFATKFSHLRKGDAYERTLYMSTLTFDVRAE